MGRTKSICPVKGCRKLLLHLPRHLRNVHKWSRQESKTAKNLYGLRKNYVFKNKEKNTKNKVRLAKACPVYGCRSMQKNMSRHLKTAHKLDPLSTEYKNLLQQAIVVELPSGSKAASFPHTGVENMPWNVLTEFSGSDSSDDSSFKPGEESSRSASLVDIGSSSGKDQQCTEGFQVPESSHSLKDADCFSPSGSDLHASDSSKSDGDERSESAITFSESSYSQDDYSSDDPELSDLDANRSVCDSEVQSLLDQFEQFLVSPDSGRAPRSAKACVQRVLRILNVISPRQDLKCLGNRNLIRDKFLDSFCKAQQYHPGTIQTFLRSLGAFYDFILSENLDVINKDEVIQMKSRLPTWKASYKTQLKIATMKKLETERRTKILPQDILQFEKSPIVKEAIKILGQSDDKSRCTKTAFVLVRDFVITELFIDNAHRAGVLANMTLQEFNNTETFEKSRYRLTVFHHKEARAGPIRVILRQSLFGWLTTYVRNFRKWVADNDDGNGKVFVTFNGKSFEYSGDISAASNSFWQKAGMKGRCGANKFRKAAVSATRDQEEIGEKTKKDLANLMGHAVSTADRYYYMEEKIASAERAAKLLPKTMRMVAGRLDENVEEKRGSDEDEEENEETAKSPDHEIESGELCAKSGNNQSTSTQVLRPLPAARETLVQKMTRFFTDEEASSSNDVISSSSFYSQPRKFASHDTVSISKIFGPMIRDKTCSMARMQQIIKINAEAKCLVKKYSITSLQNRIKYEIRALKNESACHN